MAKQKTATKSNLTSFTDVDNNLRLIALNQSFTKKKEAEMNKQMLEIQKRFEEDTREAREQVMAMEKDIELYCNEHRDEFVESKTITLNFGIVSFRLTPPKLTTLRGFTWDTVLALMKKLKLTDYIKISEGVDKEKLKTEITDAKDLATIGLQLAQSEQFYYEVNETPII
jgi:phage host-nuclease inhibitor protein Gam